MLNTIVAEALDEMGTMLEEKLGDSDGASREQAVADVISSVLTESDAIVFDGDGYAEAWHEEAARRGLLNLPNTLDALELLPQEKNVTLFSKYGVLSERELLSRHEILVEQYFLAINIEGETLESLARTMVLPAAVRYLKDLVTTIDESNDLGIDVTGVRDTAEEVARLINGLRGAVNELIKQNKEQGGDAVIDKARHIYDNVRPSMIEVRYYADRLERAVPHDYWPLPTYREILFVK